MVKSTVKDWKILFLTVTSDFLYGYTMQILILNRIGAFCPASNRAQIWGKESIAVVSRPAKSKKRSIPFVPVHVFP